MTKLILAIVASLGISGFAFAQEAGLDTYGNDQTNKITGAFKSTRVIHAHSLEMLSKGNLDFRILHRFGLVNSGASQFFGLDQATMRIGFDYGISDRLMVGIGRSTYRKELDIFVKTRLLQQSSGKKNVPFSLLLAGGAMVRTEKVFSGPKPSFSDRSSFYVQVLAGRKFNNRFSAQFSPLFVFTNTPFNIKGDKELFALGGGLRYKFSRRMAFTIDYHHPLGDMDSLYTAPLSVGVDIETGGHVFQLHFSNSVGMNERAYLTETTGAFFKGDIRFGFNLSRIFQLGKR